LSILKNIVWHILLIFFSYFASSGLDIILEKKGNCLVVLQISSKFWVLILNSFGLSTKTQSHNIQNKTVFLLKDSQKTRKLLVAYRNI